VAERLFLTGGLRYSHETKDIWRWEASGALAAVQDQAFKSTTPRLVLRYEIAEDTNVYASFSKGFKSGFINTQPPYSPVKPEKLDAYEVGFKTARGAFRFDAAAYYYDYKDLQVGAVIVVNGVNSSVSANAATAEIYGAEAQFAGRLAENLNVNAGVAYTHARYKSFPNSLVSLPSPVTGLNSGTCAPPAGRQCTQDWSGQRLARAPDWTLQLGLDYAIPASFGEIALAGNGVYTTSMPVSRSDIGLNGTGYRYEQPDTFVLNLRAAWTLPNKQWTFTVFGNNVTDETTYAVLTGSAFGDYKVENDPATYGVRIDYRF
jgi:iron complex outermembrane receptor protein